MILDLDPPVQKIGNDTVDTETGEVIENNSKILDYRKAAL